MEDLIKAFTIFLKYGNPTYPTHCEHDVMYISIDPKIVSEEDKGALNDLGFYPETADYGNVFYSYKYGSC